MREKRWPQRESLGTLIFTKYDRNEQIAVSKGSYSTVFLPNPYLKKTDFYYEIDCKIQHFQINGTKLMEFIIFRTTFDSPMGRKQEKGGCGGKRGLDGKKRTRTIRITRRTRKQEEQQEEQKQKEEQKEKKIK